MFCGFGVTIKGERLHIGKALELFDQSWGDLGEGIDGVEEALIGSTEIHSNQEGST